MGVVTRLIIDGAAMQELLNSPSGGVGANLIMRADRIIMAAREQIGHDGPLSQSIVKRFTTSELGPSVLIVAGLGLSPQYAYWVHEGNGPEGGRISARPGGTLVFKIDGATIFRKSVKTSKPNRYLSDNLDKAAG